MKTKWSSTTRIHAQSFCIDMAIGFHRVLYLEPLLLLPLATSWAKTELRDHESSGTQVSGTVTERWLRIQAWWLEKVQRWIKKLKKKRQEHMFLLFFFVCRGTRAFHVESSVSWRFEGLRPWLFEATGALAGLEHTRMRFKLEKCHHGVCRQKLKEKVRLVMS